MIPAGRSGEFFDELEIMTTAERERYLSRKLAQTVKLAYRKAPAAKAIFDRAGVSPNDIRTVKDLEKLPITRKNELIELQKANPPYGGFLAIPAEDVERVFISPGPIYEPHQTCRISWFAKTFYAAGFRKGDVVLNSFTYHMSPAGILMQESLRELGATVIPMGTGNTEIQIQTMRDLKVNGFIGTPSFLMTIIKRAEEIPIYRDDFRRQFALRRAWFTGEMLPPSLREILEGKYRIATSQAYAVTEPGGAIAYECSYKSGMHFMDDYVIEIVDPKTGKQLGPGEIGELVVTPIHNKTWGLIRFGTGDLSSYTTEPCPCGRTANRLVGIVGRASDAIKVRGMFLVGKQVEQIISGFETVSRYQVLVGRQAQRDEVTLRIELKSEAVDKAKLAEDLNKQFQDTCRLKIDRIEFVGKGTIREEQPKIVDERTWE